MKEISSSRPAIRTDSESQHISSFQEKQEGRIITDIPEQITETARERFGISSLFPYQQLVIGNILEANRNLKHQSTPVENSHQHIAENDETASEDEPYSAPNKQIVILPTGSGKSLCFMLPALLIDGITLIIFPLLSLLEDQRRRLQQIGENAAVFRGGQSRRERRRCWAGLESGEFRFILTNPEMLKQHTIRNKLTSLPLAHLVIDETHTVSEWGDTFRPSYLELTNIQRQLHIPQVTAFTATASPKILERVLEIIFPDDARQDINVIKVNPDRTNITYRVVPTISTNHDLTWLTRPDGGIPRPALVFCPTRRTAEETSCLLSNRHQDSSICYYHAGLSREEKSRREQWFFSSTSGILCCTTAYGMGVDKPDIRTVIHLTPPSTAEAYLQETGRAGRDRNHSEAILLLKEPDSDEQDDSTVLSRILQDSLRCRREALLSLLEIDMHECSGCDVCDRTVVHTAAGEQIIIQAVTKQPRRNSIEKWSSIFHYQPGDCRLSFASWRYPQAGSLFLWYKEDVKAAIQTLIKQGKLISSHVGLWKGLLYPNSK